MIESIEFKNFKALRDTKLPLGRFTLVVGPNGSGKSTALSAVLLLSVLGRRGWIGTARTAGVRSTEPVLIRANWKGKPGASGENAIATVQWNENNSPQMSWRSDPPGRAVRIQDTQNAVDRARLFSLEANRIAQSVPLQPNMELAPDGFGLAGVLDRLRDQHPERFEALNEQLGKLIPNALRTHRSLSKPRR